MFKRSKGDADSESLLAADDIEQSLPLRQVTPTAEELGDTPPTRTITPSYEARKPTVRTLQSHSTGASTPTAAAANLHVGRGLKLEGKIQSCDSLVIEGDVQATIESGTLTISETGDVRGEATVDTAEINGKFDGTLTVRKCLSINTTGRVTGTVNYGELRVEQGGKISGKVSAADQVEVKSEAKTSNGLGLHADGVHSAPANMAPH